MLLENSRSSSSSSISRICSNVIGSKLSPQSGSPIEPFSDYHHAHLVSGKGFCSKFNARRTEACCKGAKRGVRSGGGRGLYAGGMKSCEWKVNTSAYGVARTRSSTDEGGSTFLVDILCVFVRARLVLCEQKFRSR